MWKYDITLLTDSRYVNPILPNDYVKNILLEAKYLTEALEKKGLKVYRTNWDNQDFDWRETEYVLFRTTWDYFDRFHEFSTWLENVKTQTKMINPLPTLRWNMDKHYLYDLKENGIAIPPTLFIETGDKRTLNQIVLSSGWNESIIKPVVGGSGRLTYKLTPENIASHERLYRRLIKEESFLLQEYQKNITEKGEVAFVVFGGEYSHAVLKKAKQGDFRVQDDFGGTVHSYIPAKKEIKFIEEVIATCEPIPSYARVDVMWNNENELCVSELELVEPELWFRMYPASADHFAEVLVRSYFN